MTLQTDPYFSTRHGSLSSLLEELPPPHADLDHFFSVHRINISPFTQSFLVVTPPPPSTPLNRKKRSEVSVLFFKSSYHMVLRSHAERNFDLRFHKTWSYRPDANLEEVPPIPFSDPLTIPLDKLTPTGFLSHSFSPSGNALPRSIPSSYRSPLFDRITTSLQMVSGFPLLSQSPSIFKPVPLSAFPVLAAPPFPPSLESPLGGPEAARVIFFAPKRTVFRRMTPFSFIRPR